MPIGRYTRRATAGLLALVVGAAIFAFFSAEMLSNFWAEKRLGNSAAQIRSSLRSINEQIETVLESGQSIRLTELQCTPEIYAKITELVSANQFIYEGAVVLPGGKVCSSYGYQLEGLAMLKGVQSYPSKRNNYWFSVRNLSGNRGFVAVSQGAVYLWLNDVIVKNALSPPEGIEFDLVDKSSLTSLFSSDGRLPKHELLYPGGRVSKDSQGVHYTFSSQWRNVLAIESLELRDYQSTWWKIFSAVWTGSLVTIGFLIWLRLKVRQRHEAWTPKLRKALKENQFYMHYQPIVNMQTGRWVGAESLIRWHVSGALISPAQFIPAAEKEGFIGEITRWVVLRVAEDYSKYLSSFDGFYLTVNLSSQEVEDELFPDFVRQALIYYKVPANVIVFEVTEGGLANFEKAAVQLRRLRDQGHRIAIDDFGTGYSSLSYLDSLPIDILKIDRSFLSAEKMSAEDSLWLHVVNMARTLKLAVVAEGVEGEHQSEPLMQAGVVLAQGWLYSRDLEPAILRGKYLRQHPMYVQKQI